MCIFLNDSSFVFTFSDVLMSVFTVSYYAAPVHGVRIITQRTCAQSSAITYCVWLHYVAHEVTFLLTYLFDGKPSTIYVFHFMYVLNVGVPLEHSFAFNIFLPDVSMVCYCSESVMNKVFFSVCMSYFLLSSNMFYVPNNVCRLI